MDHATQPRQLREVRFVYTEALRESGGRKAICPLSRIACRRIRGQSGRATETREFRDRADLRVAPATGFRINNAGFERIISPSFDRNQKRYQVL